MQYTLFDQTAKYFVLSEFFIEKKASIFGKLFFFFSKMCNNTLFDQTAKYFILSKFFFLRKRLPSSGSFFFSKMCKIILYLANFPI